MVNKNIKKLCEIGELGLGSFEHFNGLYVYLGLEDGSKKHKILKNRLHRFYRLTDDTLRPAGIYLFSDHGYNKISPL